MKLLTFLSLVALTLIAQAQTPAEVQEEARLRADPTALSQRFPGSLKAMSTGGKARDEPWKTDYGSYQRTDVSTRQIVCQVSTVSRIVQRARVQCIVLSRNLETNDKDFTIIEDTIVTVPRAGTVSIGAFVQATSTDDNYEALGIRNRSGSKYLGWMWRAIDATGNVVAVICSQSAFDRYAREIKVEPKVEP
jgi:hypothetical protein